MTKMKKFTPITTKKIVLGVFLWLLTIVLILAVVVFPLQSRAQQRVPTAKQTHYLYQTKDGYIKQYTPHPDRQSCLNTAYKLKLKNNTWQCLPS